MGLLLKRRQRRERSLHHGRYARCDQRFGDELHGHACSCRRQFRRHRSRRQRRTRVRQHPHQRGHDQRPLGEHQCQWKRYPRQRRRAQCRELNQLRWRAYRLRPGRDQSLCGRRDGRIFGFRRIKLVHQRQRYDLGRRLYAMGNNPVAARFSGIALSRVTNTAEYPKPSLAANSIVSGLPVPTM